mgnify:FL=1
MNVGQPTINEVVSFSQVNEPLKKFKQNLFVIVQISFYSAYMISEYVMKNSPSLFALNLLWSI